MSLDEEQRAQLVQQIAPFAARTAHQLPIGAEAQTLVGHAVSHFTIAKPDDIDDTTAWGFHIYTDPVVGVGYNGASGEIGTMPSNSEIAGSLFTTSPGAASLEPLLPSLVTVVIFKESELPLTIDKLSTFTADRIVTYEDASLLDLITPMMLTSLSYKCVNTTAEIEKQGAKLAYRQNCTPTTLALHGTVTNLTKTEQYGVSEQSTQIVPWPPTSPSSASPLNSRAGPASEGDVEVQPFDYVEMNLLTPTIGSVGYAEPITNLTSWKFLGTDRQSFPLATPYGSSDVWISRVFAKERIGTWYTGLSAGSTFQITIHAISERSPKIGSDELKYSSVPPPRDNKLLAAATIAARTYPLGMPASANSFGSFLKGALGTVSKLFSPVRQIAQAVSNTLPGPLGRMAGMLGTGMDMVSSITGSDSSRRPEPARRVDNRQVALTSSARPRESRVAVEDDGQDEIIRIPNARAIRALQGTPRRR